MAEPVTIHIDVFGDGIAAALIVWALAWVIVRRIQSEADR